jgi:hypothetical protein
VQGWVAGSALTFIAATSAWTVYSFAPGAGTQSAPFADRFGAVAFADRFAPVAGMNAAAPQAGFSVAPPKTGGKAAIAVNNRATTVAVKKVAKVDPIAAPQIPREVRDGYASLMDPTRRLGSQPGAFVTASVLAAQAEPDLTGSLVDPEKQTAQLPEVVKQASHNVPMPSARPSSALRLPQTKGPSPREIVQANKATGLELAKQEAVSIFEKIFGKPQSGTQLAYAAPDGGITSDGRDKPAAQSSIDRYTAIYDITAKTVYMPDGSKLEAHSGLGPKMDNPKYVHVRMHGATPPHVYDLKMREALFHGSEAIRLHPVGGPAAIHGRTGLLAHPYLLGPRGDSNGCVSFKDYSAFVAAYKRGEVKRMIVVASGGGERSYAMR